MKKLGNTLCGLRRMHRCRAAAAAVLAGAATLEALGLLWCLWQGLLGAAVLALGAGAALAVDIAWQLLWYELRFLDLLRQMQAALDGARATPYIHRAGKGACRL